MALATERPVAPAPREKNSWLVREAVKWVPLGDYFKLRLLPGVNLVENEYRQISAGVKVFSDWVSKNESVYNVGDDIEPAGDLRISASRIILKKTPLPVYLTALHEWLKGESGRENDDLEEYIALTEKVVEAVGTSSV